MTTDKKAMTELRERLDAERAKAVQKYGADALLPGGRPDYDVLDYAINEALQRRDRTGRGHQRGGLGLRRVSDPTPPGAQGPWAVARGHGEVSGG